MRMPRSMMEDQEHKKTTAELRAECEKRGLPSDGQRGDLVDRIVCDRERKRDEYAERYGIVI